MRRAACFFLLLALFLNQGVNAAQDPRAEYIRSGYTKFEYRIPMRDGVKLFTAVYRPNDTSRKYPFLMTRTPYSVKPYGADNYKTRLAPTEAYEKEGFIFVFQDVRGRYMSEGTFVNMRPHIDVKKTNKDIDESTDTFDTIEWLLKHVENNNGKAGMWGISYPGFFTSAGAIDSHPALKAVSPQAPVSNFHGDDIFHNGAFWLSPNFRFFSGFGVKREGPTTESVKPPEYMKNADDYQFYLEMGPLKNANTKYFKNGIEFWNQIMEHPNYDDFWKAMNIIPHLKNITAAVMTVGGWYDAEDLYGPLKTFQAIERNNPGIFNVLVMGPWQHGGWSSMDGSSLGSADFGFATSKYYNENILLPFFKHYLIKGEGKYEFPKATMFEAGANRWRSFDTWPPANLEKSALYPCADSKLSFSKQGEKGAVSDSYISDPSKPVPFTYDLSAMRQPRFMAEDQRFSSRRPDVLVYQSQALDEDLTLAGPLRANLFVSTTGTDSDWIVKVIDLYPAVTPEDESAGPDKRGWQVLVRAETMRGRFRESMEHPKPFVPNEITPISFDLQDVLYTFKRGHSIMVQIQSSWFPLIDRNPQKYVPNIFKANDDDFITTTNRVFRSQEYPSRIEIGILR
jgi:uncharacterized protein